MEKIKVKVVTDFEIVVEERTAEEVMKDFCYELSDGAVTELGIEDGEGSLVAYGLGDGRYEMWVSGRGLYCTVGSRDEAVKMLVEDELRWRGM